MEITIENIGKDQDKYLNSLRKGEEVWLVERNLFAYLRHLFPNDTIHKQYKISSYKVDYLVGNKIVIEFQGYQHFTKSKIAYKDKIREEYIRSKGYDFIEIPYFVQMSKETINHLFSKELDIKRNFPHGFIHPKAVLPCDFCRLGKEKFFDVLHNFPPEVKKECYDSIKRREELDRIPYFDLI